MTCGYDSARLWLMMELIRAQNKNVVPANSELLSRRPTSHLKHHAQPYQNIPRPLHIKCRFRANQMGEERQVETGSLARAYPVHLAC